MKRIRNTVFLRLSVKAIFLRCDGTCPDCGKIFTEPRPLRMHMRICKASLRCYICKQQFASTDELDHHKKSHDVHCEICFKQISSLLGKASIKKITSFTPPLPVHQKTGCQRTPTKKTVFFNYLFFDIEQFQSGPERTILRKKIQIKRTPSINIFNI